MSFSADLVDLVEHLKEVSLCINSGVLNSREDLGDDLLAGGRIGLVSASP